MRIVDTALEASASLKQLRISGGGSLFEIIPDWRYNRA